MFGFTKLTEEEKSEHSRKKRLEAVEALIRKESEVRAESLAKAQAYQEEFDKLSKKA